MEERNVRFAEASGETGTLHSLRPLREPPFSPNKKPVTILPSHRLRPETVLILHSRLFLKMDCPEAVYSSGGCFTALGQPTWRQCCCSVGVSLGSGQHYLTLLTTAAPVVAAKHTCIDTTGLTVISLLHLEAVTSLGRGRLKLVRADLPDAPLLLQAVSESSAAAFLAVILAARNCTRTGRDAGAEEDLEAAVAAGEASSCDGSPRAYGPLKPLAVAGKASPGSSANGSSPLGQLTTGSPLARSSMQPG